MAASTQHPPALPAPPRKQTAERLCSGHRCWRTPTSEKEGGRAEGYLVCPGLGALARRVRGPRPWPGWSRGASGRERVPARMKHAMLSSPGGRCAMPLYRGKHRGSGRWNDSPVIHSQLSKSCCSDCTVISPPATPRAQPLHSEDAQKRTASIFF